MIFQIWPYIFNLARLKIYACRQFCTRGGGQWSSTIVHTALLEWWGRVCAAAFEDNHLSNSIDSSPFYFSGPVRSHDACLLPSPTVFLKMNSIHLESLCFRWQHQAVLLVVLFSISFIQPHILCNTMLLLSVLSCITRSYKGKGEKQILYLLYYFYLIQARGF